MKVAIALITLLIFGLFGVLIVNRIATSTCKCDCVDCECKNAVLRNEDISDQQEGGGGDNSLPTESPQ
jgi:hypothetical protein